MHQQSWGGPEVQDRREALQSVLVINALPSCGRILC